MAETLHCAVAPENRSNDTRYEQGPFRGFDLDEDISPIKPRLSNSYESSVNVPDRINGLSIQPDNMSTLVSVPSINLAMIEESDRFTSKTQDDLDMSTFSSNGTRDVFPNFSRKRSKSLSDLSPRKDSAVADLKFCPESDFANQSGYNSDSSEPVANLTYVKESFTESPKEKLTAGSKESSKKDALLELKRELSSSFNSLYAALSIVCLSVDSFLDNFIGFGLPKKFRKAGVNLAIVIVSILIFFLI